MAFKRVAVVLLLGCVLLVIGQSPSAAGTKKKAVNSDRALPAVENVLRIESAGEVDRRAQLGETLQQHPDSAAAHWQAGFVRDGKSWRSFDVPTAALESSDLWRDYLSRRQNAATTFEGQLDVADWCRNKRFYDQERAHLTAALLLAPPPEQPALLQRLGYRQIGTHWLSREQLFEWQRINHSAEASLKKWSSKLEHIAARLIGTARQHETAVAELHALADRSAIPAIEFILTGQDERCAAAAVEALRQIDGPESSLALTKQALFSKWPTVRETASAALKKRTFEDFVPALIALLAIPSQEQIRFAYDASPGATLLQSYIVAVETEDQFRLQVFNVIGQTVDVAVKTLVRGTPGGPVERFVVAPPVAAPDNLRLVADQLRAQELEQDAREDRILALNDRVVNVLSNIAERASSTDLHDWWRWWSEYTDTQKVTQKPVVVVEEYDAPLPIYVPVVKSVPRPSCFAAGTPVWTETGSQPIEKVAIGDRVLAKDVETGELAYKPVLQTTVRPPKELTTLRFGDETIVCTGGHRFWNSGSGWIKARDLTPQTLLHTVKGNAPVWSAKKGNTAETYNLVVADFHTYFVGKTGVLCQDLLIPRGTNSVVPGLARK